MIAYLTSHVGGSYIKDGIRIPSKLNTDNGFLDNLQKHWKADSNVLIISADANAAEINDSIMNTFVISFPMSGLSINRINICDKRNEYIVNRIGDYDVIILTGEHVPTQNRFFEKIRLKVDGSFFLIENGATTLFGEAYVINDGNIKQICEKDKSICIR